MKAEIIGVGTELLLGQIANTNAQWISKQLAYYGIPVYFHSVTGDNMERLESSFEIASNRSDIIIITGGLGPTEDDLTREAAQPFIRQPLVEEPTSMAKIEGYYKKNGKRMTENNRKQARVFKEAKVLINKEGMAPGQIVESDGKVWVFLPGVPSEMKSLMKLSVLPYLQKTFNLKSEITSEMLRFIGIGESKLESEIDDLISEQTNPTLAPLASEGEVGLRLTASGESREVTRGRLAEMKKKVLGRIGQYYYGSDEITVAERVRDLLKEQNLTLGTAESLTGGKFMESMIALPGASSVCQGSLVAYNAFTKEKIIKVPKNIIEEYGTVSRQCAESMVLNARGILHSDISLSFTGVAGPDPSEGHSPGTVFIGIQIGNQEPIVEEYHFHGGRDQVRNRTVKKGFELLFHCLKDHS